MLKPTTIKWTGPKPTRHYTVVPNELVHDKELTSSAVRVALYLWSRADDFTVGERAIAKYLGMSNKTVGSALNNLIERRWLVRRKCFAKNGHLYGYEYVADPAKRLDPAYFSQQTVGDL